MRDMSNNMKIITAIVPLSVADNTGWLQAALIDRRGFDSVTFAIAFGASADAAFDGTVTVVESDDAATEAGGTAVADADLVGTEAAIAFTNASDGACHKIGYVGNKRYVGIRIATTNNASACLLGAVCILQNPSILPQDAQVVAVLA